MQVDISVTFNRQWELFFALANFWHFHTGCAQYSCQLACKIDPGKQ